MRKMPSTPEEALAATDAIADGGGTAWGARTLWPPERVAAGDWTPVQWFDGRLAEAAYTINRSPLLEPVGLRHKIGPAGQRIHDAFRKCTKEDPDAVPIFWSVSPRFHSTPHSFQDGWGKHKPLKLKLSQKYWHLRSHTLLAQRHRTTNGVLTAIWSPIPSLGAGWTPVTIEGKAQGKALTMWWNSTPARIMLLSLRSRTLSYPKWSLGQLRGVGVPKPDNPAWSSLADAWEEVCDVEMLPLSRGEECEARRIIDRAAAEALNVDEEQVAEWRRMLAVEPTISNRPAP